LEQVAQAMRTGPVRAGLARFGQMEVRFMYANDQRGWCGGEIMPEFPAIAEIAMDQDESEDTTIYKVVINHEEQYSIWAVDRENPAGWRDAGKTGRKPECLAYIGQVWTDMRPLSLRKQMDHVAS
jgi:MbtH protein